MNDQQEPTQPSSEAVFAGRVRELRERLGITQGALALALQFRGLSSYNDSTVTKLEKGDRGVRLGEAVAIAEELGVTLDAMLHPGMTREQQLVQAREELRRAELRADAASSEYEAAKARLAQLNQADADEQPRRKKGGK